jgi:hypothetical protein
MIADSYNSERGSRILHHSKMKEGPAPSLWWRSAADPGYRALLAPAAVRSYPVRPVMTKPKGVVVFPP